MPSGVTSSDALVDAVRAALREVADPSKAPGMQAYMKTTDVFLGVRLPDVRAVVRAHPPPDLDTLLAAALALWRDAEAREERYAATMLLRAAPGVGRLELLHLATEMIVTGAWWDHVDAVAHTTCALLQAHRAELTPVLREWSVADDHWLRRSSIIGQLDAKDATDLVLLTDVIEANAADREFFVRKAIGWALREYAKTDPDAVARYVRAHATRLSPLSQREALRNMR